MGEYEEAASIIRANEQLADFVGPRDPSVVEAAEAAIGRPLPPTYRRFVSEFGAGNIGSFEVLGVTKAEFQNASVPNGIWYTLSEREDGMPDNLLVVGEAGDGSLYALDLDEGDDPPVVVYEPGSGEPPGERIAGDFGSFLLDGVRRVSGDRV
jgi:hypothetical protein